MSAATRTRSGDAPQPGRRLREWVEQQPGLSLRARRLLLEGAVEGRYRGWNAGDGGYRLMTALAVAVSQSGRERTPAQWYNALVLRPTAGRVWAQGPRTRKGDWYTEGKLGEIPAKTRRFVGSSGTIVCRTDAVVGVVGVCEAVERAVWPGEQRGDRREEPDGTSVAGGALGRPGLSGLGAAVGRVDGLGEVDGGGQQRAVVGPGMAAAREGGGEKNSGSQWVLRVPPAVVEIDGAASGQQPAAGERGAGGVPAMHTPSLNTRSLAKVIAHDAFHHFDHDVSGARLMACLDPLEGSDVPALVLATGLHRTTVRWRLDKLLVDGLVEAADGLFYLLRHLAGVSGEGLWPDEEQLVRVAEERGTKGLGERCRQRHVDQRAVYQRWLEHWARRSAENRRHARPPLRLVPEGVVDPETGELLDEAWRGWDTSDPARPVWREHPARPAAGACA